MVQNRRYMNQVSSPGKAKLESKRFNIKKKAYSGHKRMVKNKRHRKQAFSKGKAESESVRINVKYTE